jgi:hypothetical protein
MLDTVAPTYDEAGNVITGVFKEGDTSANFAMGKYASS